MTSQLDEFQAQPVRPNGADKREPAEWLKVTIREGYNSVFTGKIVTDFSAQKLCFTWQADGQTKFSEFTRLNAEVH